MKNERIKSIYCAAVKLFLQQGYSKTQINHIAKEVGVSVGTIYHDFIGKRELMHFILKCAINPDFIEGDFDRPITDDIFAGLDEEIQAAFDEAAAEYSRRIELVGKSYFFEDFVSDTYDLLDRFAVGCLFIEKNKSDCPRLAERYISYRKKFFAAVNEYISAFMDNGEIRRLEDPKLTIILMIEILSWWTMDRKYNSFEPLDIPSTTAKRICMDNIVSAYKK